MLLPGGAGRPTSGKLARQVVAPHVVRLAGRGARVSRGVLTDGKKSRVASQYTGLPKSYHARVGEHAVAGDGLGVGRLRVVAALSQRGDATNLVTESASSSSEEGIFINEVHEVFFLALNILFGIRHFLTLSALLLHVTILPQHFDVESRTVWTSNLKAP